MRRPYLLPGLMALSALATPISGQTLESDALASHLVGAWSGSGLYDGNRLELTRVWSLELGGQFLRGDMGVSMPNGATFGALMYWKSIGDGRFEIVWMDGIGRMQSLSAVVDTASGVVSTEYVDEFAENGPEERRWEYQRSGPDEYIERLYRKVADDWELLTEWTFNRTVRE